MNTTDSYVPKGIIRMNGSPVVTVGFKEYTYTMGKYMTDLRKVDRSILEAFPNCEFDISVTTQNCNGVSLSRSNARFGVVTVAFFVDMYWNHVTVNRTVDVENPEMVKFLDRSNDFIIEWFTNHEVPLGEQTIRKKSKKVLMEEMAYREAMQKGNSK